jgi:hypothetical protein
MASESKAKQTTEMLEPQNSSDTKSIAKDGSHEDRSAQHHSEDASIAHAEVDQMEHPRKDEHFSLRASGPVSASAVSAVMGPPPPEDKEVSRWERWRRDRREAREIGMLSPESSRRWKVGNVMS